MLKRYGWLGTTRKQKVCELVSSCCDTWLADWCLQHEALEAGLAELAVISQAKESLAWKIEPADGCLLVAMDKRQLDVFGGRLVLAAADGSDGIAAELCRAALQDLATRLVARMGLSGGTPVISEEEWPEWVAHPEWGALGLNVTIDDFDVQIAMDRAIIDAAFPKTVKAAGAALSSRAATLGTVAVPLAAVLDFGLVSARDLAGLHPGEVLVSECPLDQPIMVRASQHRVFDASLTQADHHLAVVAASPSNREDL